MRGNEGYKVGRFRELGGHLFKIISMLSEDQELCKLLYYNNENPLSQPDLTEKQREGLIHRQLLLVPKIPEEDNDLLSFVTVLFENMPNSSQNWEFRDVTLRIDVICPPSLWVLNEPAPRPYLIMSAIDRLIDERDISTIGKAHYVTTDRFGLTQQYTGYSVIYHVTDFN